MSTSNELTAVSYDIEAIGKLFSDSKTRHSWVMDVDGETHLIVVTASWKSGKFVVELNGYERFHQVVNGVFTYSFRFKERFFRINQEGDQLRLLIDTVPFEQYSRKAKAAQAAILKSYESRVKAQAPEVTTKSPQPEPFSGDLGKRLGKKQAPSEDRSNEYLPQDDEDYFSARPNVLTMSTPHTVSDLTVIPDLIDFGPQPPAESVPIDDKVKSAEELTKPSTPLADGQVTPREQISPSKLVNPFAAFDELVKPAAASRPVVNDNPFT